MTTILEGCGCFSDDELNVKWPCTLHRTPDGVTATPNGEREKLEQEEIRKEAEAWLKW